MSHPKYHLSQSQQYSDDAGWLKNEPQSWRHNLSKLTGSVDRNLRSLKQLENPRLLDIAGLQREALAHRMQADMLAQRVHGHPDTLSLQKSELGNLLAAVQGSLADLRVEVAAAKRLSTDASAAVHDASPPPKHLPNRAESVTRRHRYDRGPAAAAEALTAHSALDRSHSFAVGGLGSLLASPVQRNRRPPYSPSRRVALAYIADPAALPAAGAGHVTGEDLVRVLDSKMDELSERIEKQFGLSLTGQQQVQPPGEAVALPPPQLPLPPPPPSPPPPKPSTDPLILLGLSKADAAERATVDLQGQLSIVDKRCGKTADEVAQQAQASQQHWERVCRLVADVESLQAFCNSGSAASAQSVSSLDARLASVESRQARASKEQEEQQRLLLALTSAVQKAEADAEAWKAGRRRQEELEAQLQAALARMAEVETRVDGLGTAVLASKTRELQQAGTAPSSDHSLTASEQRFKALEERLASLDSLQSKLDLVTARAQDSAMAALEARLQALEARQHLDNSPRRVTFGNSPGITSKQASMGPSQPAAADRRGLGEVSQRAASPTSEASTPPPAVSPRPSLPPGMAVLLGLPDAPVSPAPGRQPKAGAGGERLLAGATSIRGYEPGPSDSDCSRGAAQPHWPMGSAGQEEAQGSCSKASAPGKTRDSQLKSLIEHQKELGMAKALLQARVDQLERKVQAAIGNSFDRDAREARLSVAEEMSREAWVDLEDNVKPGLAAMQKQADALQLRLATLEQQQQPAQGPPGRDGDVGGVGSLQVADAAAEVRPKRMLFRAPPPATPAPVAAAGEEQQVTEQQCTQVGRPQQVLHHQDSMVGSQAGQGCAAGPGSQSAGAGDEQAEEPPALRSELQAVAAQVRLLSAAVEEAAGQAGSLHKGVLDLVQPALEELTTSSAAAGNLLQALQLQQAALQGQVQHTQAQVQDLSSSLSQAKAETVAGLGGVGERLDGLEEVHRAQAARQGQLDAAVLQLGELAPLVQAAAEQHAAVLQQVEGLASTAQLADLQQQVAELEEQVAELRQAPSLSSDVEAVVAVQGKLQVQVQGLQRTVEELQDAGQALKQDVSRQLQAVSGTLEELDIPSCRAEVRLLSTAVKAASTDQAAQQLQLAKLQDTVGGVAQSQDELCRMLEQVQSAVQAGSSAHKGLQHELQQLQDLVAAVAGTDPAALPRRVQQLEAAVEETSNGQPGVSDQLLSLQGALQSSLKEHAAMQQQLSKLEAVVGGLEASSHSLEEAAAEAAGRACQALDAAAAATRQAAAASASQTPTLLEALEPLRTSLQQLTVKLQQQADHVASLQAAMTAQLPSTGQLKQLVHEAVAQQLPVPPLASAPAAEQVTLQGQAAALSLPDAVKQLDAVLHDHSSQLQQLASTLTALQAAHSAQQQQQQQQRVAGAAVGTPPSSGTRQGLAVSATPVGRSFHNNLYSSQGSTPATPPSAGMPPASPALAAAAAPGSVDWAVRAASGYTGGGASSAYTNAAFSLLASSGLDSSDSLLEGLRPPDLAGTPAPAATPPVPITGARAGVGSDAGGASVSRRVFHVSAGSQPGSPETPPEDASVLDKAVYFERLTAKKGSSGGGALPAEAGLTPRLSLGGVRKGAAADGTAAGGAAAAGSSPPPTDSQGAGGRGQGNSLPSLLFDRLPEQVVEEDSYADDAEEVEDEEEEGEENQEAGKEVQYEDTQFSNSGSSMALPGMQVADHDCSLEGVLHTAPGYQDHGIEFASTSSELIAVPMPVPDLDPASPTPSPGPAAARAAVSDSALSLPDQVMRASQSSLQALEALLATREPLPTDPTPPALSPAPSSQPRTIEQARQSLKPQLVQPLVTPEKPGDEPATPGVTPLPPGGVTPGPHSSSHSRQELPAPVQLALAMGAGDSTPGSKPPPSPPPQPAPTLGLTAPPAAGPPTAAAALPKLGLPPLSRGLPPLTRTGLTGAAAPTPPPATNLAATAQPLSTSPKPTPPSHPTAASGGVKHEEQNTALGHVIPQQPKLETPSISTSVAPPHQLPGPPAPQPHLGGLDSSLDLVTDDEVATEDGLSAGDDSDGDPFDLPPELPGMGHRSRSSRRSTADTPPQPSAAADDQQQHTPSPTKAAGSAQMAAAMASPQATGQRSSVEGSSDTAMMASTDMLSRLLISPHRPSEPVMPTPTAETAQQPERNPCLPLAENPENSQGASLTSSSLSPPPSPTTHSAPPAPPAPGMPGSQAAAPQALGGSELDTSWLTSGSFSDLGLPGLDISQEASRMAELFSRSSLNAHSQEPAAAALKGAEAAGHPQQAAGSTTPLHGSGLGQEATYGSQSLSEQQSALELESGLDLEEEEVAQNRVQGTLSFASDDDDDDSSSAHSQGGAASSSLSSPTSSVQHGGYTAGQDVHGKGHASTQNPLAASQDDSDGELELFSRPAAPQPLTLPGSQNRLQASPTSLVQPRATTTTLAALPASKSGDSQRATAAPGGAGQGPAAGVQVLTRMAGRPGLGDESMSIDFDDDDDDDDDDGDDDELPMFAPTNTKMAAAAQGQGRPSGRDLGTGATGVAATTPGIVLDEDLEDVDTSTGLMAALQQQQQPRHPPARSGGEQVQWHDNSTAMDDKGLVPSTSFIKGSGQGSQTIPQSVRQYGSQSGSSLDSIFDGSQLSDLSLPDVSQQYLGKAGGEAGRRE